MQRILIHSILMRKAHRWLKHDEVPSKVLILTLNKLFYHKCITTFAPTPQAACRKVLTFVVVYS